MFKTKSTSSVVYELNDPKDRQRYFAQKAGQEIIELREYLQHNTFIAYMLGKKQAGKGTYTKLLAEALDLDSIRHFSVGDLMRSFDEVKINAKAKADMLEYLKNNYRGYISVEEAFEAFLNRSTKALIPTEFVLTLIKRELEKSGKVNWCIDGFPRNLDQVSYSLYFRELIGYRDDPDIFVIIDVPEAVIDERMKFRRACPKCGLSRNLTLNPTSLVKYDKQDDQYYLLCDNSKCSPTRMIAKEGDEKGTAFIRERLEMDDTLIRKALTLHGIPKILLRSSVPVEIANEMVDEYEITKKISFEWDPGKKKVNVNEQQWTYIDDNGIESYTLKAPTVVLSLIRGLHEILIEGKG